MLQTIREMRVLFSGATICGGVTLKRLVLLADEIGFMDRPSITFRHWGTLGRDSEIRTFDTSCIPILFSAHAPPSGPPNELYTRYIEADLANAQFVQAFLDGLRSSEVFGRKFLAPGANYGSASGDAIRTAILADEHLSNSNLSGSLEPKRMFAIDTAEDRQETLKFLVIEASIHVTNAIVVTEQSGLLPISDDLHFSRLMLIRSTDPAYVGSSPTFAPALGLDVAKAVIPDAALSEIHLDDLFRYREKARGVVCGRSGTCPTGTG